MKYQKKYKYMLLILCMSIIVTLLSASCVSSKANIDNSITSDNTLTADVESNRYTDKPETPAQINSTSEEESNLYHETETIKPTSIGTKANDGKKLLASASSYEHPIVNVFGLYDESDNYSTTSIIVETENKSKSFDLFIYSYGGKAWVYIDADNEYIIITYTDIAGTKGYKEGILILDKELNEIPMDSIEDVSKESFDYYHNEEYIKIFLKSKSMESRYIIEKATLNLFDEYNVNYDDFAIGVLDIYYIREHPQWDDRIYQYVDFSQRECFNTVGYFVIIYEYNPESNRFEFESIVFEELR